MGDWEIERGGMESKWEADLREKQIIILRFGGIKIEEMRREPGGD